jgi:hypothetical protein
MTKGSDLLVAAYLACLATLVLGGPGAFAVDGLLEQPEDETGERKRGRRFIGPAPQSDFVYHDQ